MNIHEYQAKELLQAPDPTTLKGKRDRAILSVFLFHGLRREEVATLKAKDIRELRGVKHLRVHGKGGKLRNIPLHPGTAELINDYLELAGHGSPVLPVALLMGALIMLEPDLGTTAALMVIVFALFFFAGASWKMFVALIVTGVGALVLCILAAIASNKGEVYRYPVNWRLVK